MSVILIYISSASEKYQVNAIKYMRHIKHAWRNEWVGEKHSSVLSMRAMCTKVYVINFYESHVHKGVCDKQCSCYTHLYLSSIFEFFLNYIIWCN